MDRRESEPALDANQCLREASDLVAENSHFIAALIDHEAIAARAHEQRHRTTLDPLRALVCAGARSFSNRPLKVRKAQGRSRSPSSLISDADRIVR